MVTVPKGKTIALKPITLSGPCKSSNIRFNVRSYNASHIYTLFKVAFWYLAKLVGTPYVNVNVGDGKLSWPGQSICMGK